MASLIQQKTTSATDTQPLKRSWLRARGIERAEGRPRSRAVPRVTWLQGQNRAVLLRLKAFDWNCPQHITPRFTEAELARALEPVGQRIMDLDNEVRALRAAGPRPVRRGGSG